MAKYDFISTVSGMFQSLTGFKYSFHEAVSDLFDNSIDAGATTVWIYTTTDLIRIVDNGRGMDKETLVKAISPWATMNSPREKGAKGKYGIGLKAAGFSLGEIIEIHTKSEDDVFRTVQLDFDKLSKNEVKSIDGSEKVTDLWKSQKLDTGTIIEIRKVNSRKVTTDQIDALRSKLGLVYYGMIREGELKVLVNNSEVQPLDPLMSDLAKNPDNFYKRFPKKTIDYTDKNGTKVRFSLTAAHVGRGLYWSETEQKKYRYFLRKDPEAEDAEDSARKKLITRIDDQGLYISRNGRLITLGGWYKTRPLSHHHAPFRVLLEYSSEGDIAMGVDHTKTKPELEKDLIDIFNTKYIDAPFTVSEALFREEGVKYQAKRQHEKADKELKKRPLPKPEPVDLMMDKDKKRAKDFPEYEEKQKALKAQLENEAKEEDRWFKLVDNLPHDLIWDFKVNKDGDVTLLFNENHPGYQALFYEDNADKARRNLNSFFYNMACYEANFVKISNKLTPHQKEDLEKHFNAFRRYISKHFRDF